MTATQPRRPALVRALLQEDLNFLLTNRIPRRLATKLVGWWSRIEQPLLTRMSLAVWQWFADDMNLDEAKTREFRSMRECFIRELRPGTRPVDQNPDTIVSPCDAVVGACGRVDGTTVLQAKGFPYPLESLLGDRALVERHRGGLYATLRLRSSMYHRFHAPCAAVVRRVIYLAGDTWNVNPIALRRIEQLFCRNERAVIELGLANPDHALTLVAVAAILVASIKLHCLDETLHMHYSGPQEIHCGAAYARGEELGYFEQGSTILVFAAGPYRFADNLHEGAVIRVGEPLLKLCLPITMESAS